ncbi:MAG: hypothetical protein RMK18_11010 [Armatimonadota bacterium]|nr:hypothetical protein [Armatimonadota bacterium]
MPSKVEHEAKDTAQWTDLTPIRYRFVTGYELFRRFVTRQKVE